MSARAIMFSVAHRTTEIEHPDETALDDYPEIATNAYWRGMMKRRREAKELTQAQLGARVGVSQNVISKMESGSLISSKAVIPICNLLQIPPPMAAFEDELDQRWYEAGRRIRSVDERMFETLLVGAEAQLANLMDQADRERDQ